MIYFVPDPYCDDGVTIQHVMEGVFSMNAKNSTCGSCITFMLRVAPVLDNMDDENATKFLMALAGVEIPGE